MAAAVAAPASITAPRRLPICILRLSQFFGMRELSEIQSDQLVIGHLGLKYSSATYRVHYHTEHRATLTLFRVCSGIPRIGQSIDRLRE